MLHENFFMSAANNRNSSEGATPARMEMEHKSLYMVEELPSSKLCTSLLKQISSNDPTFGRQLYQMARQIDVNGKLIINTNNCPNVPGDDIATWDRMILIPWDCRYALKNKDIDRSKWILPSDPGKMGHITSLTNAFMTVCLNELHSFFKESLQPDGKPACSILPIPDAIVDLVAKKREDLFPLIPFIKKYVVETDKPSEQADINQVFYSYSMFMSRRRKKIYDSIDTFIEMLAKVGLETVFNSDQMETFVVGHKLTQAGIELAEVEQSKERVTGDTMMNDSKENHFFAVFKPSQSIVSAFARGNKRPREEEDFKCFADY